MGMDIVILLLEQTIIQTVKILKEEPLFIMVPPRVCQPLIVGLEKATNQTHIMEVMCRMRAMLMEMDIAM